MSVTLFPVFSTIENGPGKGSVIAIRKELSDDDTPAASDLNEDILALPPIGDHSSYVSPTSGEMNRKHEILSFIERRYLPGS